MTQRSQESDPELWPISVKGLWGYINKYGSSKIAPQYAKAERFRDGLGLVEVLGTSEEDLAFERNYDAFINGSGNFVIAPGFPAFYPRVRDWDAYQYTSFDDCVAIVKDGTSSDGVRGLIDRNGQLVAPMEFTKIDNFGEGLCTAMRKDSNGNRVSGYMNYTGQFIIQPNGFLSGSQFREGRAVIHIRIDQNAYVMMIDRHGHILVNGGVYDVISRVHAGLSRVVKDGQVGLIDRSGTVVIPLGEYKKIIEPYPAGQFYLAAKDDGYYAVDRHGVANRLPDYEAEPMRFCHDLILLKANDCFGYASLDGRQVVPVAFGDLAAFDGTLCLFHNKCETGYVNREGRLCGQPINLSVRL